MLYQIELAPRGSAQVPEGRRGGLNIPVFEARASGPFCSPGSAMSSFVVR